MSKERARAREARQADTARRVADADARNARQVAARRRKDRRSAALRTVLPRRQRWTRRTREQRAITVAVLLLIGVGTYVLLDDWGLRVAVGLVALLALPAVVTMILDRSTR